MFLSFVYEIALCLLAFFALPKVIYQRLVKGKYQQSLSQRFGFNFPKIEKKNQKLIWIHAVSVGETRAVVSLAKLFKEKYPSCLILISSITETGHAEAKRSLPFADYHVYLPIDLYFIIKPIVERVKPDLVLISETDLWYRFLKTAADQGAKIALINGKVSERSALRFKRFSFFTRSLFNLFDQILVQNDTYQKRFIGFNIAENKIHITGNLKFDCDYPVMNENEKNMLEKKFHFHKEDLIVVIASTHHPEERDILTALSSLLKQYPQLKILLVPRHPERFDEVAHLLENQSLSFHRFSQMDPHVEEGRFILVDAMGLLLKCYQLADFAIVGGSFTDRIGGHNVLEPCAYGVPVIFGPFMYSQPELFSLIADYQAGIQTTLTTLPLALSELIENQSKYLEMSKNGLKLTQEARGASQRTFVYLEKILNHYS